MISYDNSSTKAKSFILDNYNYLSAR